MYNVKGRRHGCMKGDDDSTRWSIFLFCHQRTIVRLQSLVMTQKISQMPERRAVDFRKIALFLAIMLPGVDGYIGSREEAETLRILG